MPGVLQHHVHETRAPQAATPGRIAADIAARLGDEAGSAARGHSAAAARGVRVVAGQGVVAETARLQLRRAALEARAACMMPVMMMPAGVMHVIVPLCAMTMRPR